jgi:hypothetical protein
MLDPMKDFLLITPRKILGGAIVAVATLPLGATGKVQKNELRWQFKDFVLPGA